MQTPHLNEISEEYFHGCCPTPLLNFPSHQNSNPKTGNTCAAYCRDFAAATTKSIFPSTQFTNHESLPSLQDSLTTFTKTYPQYNETDRVDQIREQEYNHLSLSKHTCLDYIGIGLFPYSQLEGKPNFSFFGISYKTGSLLKQLAHDGKESELEWQMKKRIFRFLNISENDYSMVFTANRTSAFKLLAESYPFKSSNKLLTVYDYESEAVEAMINSSEKKEAEIMSAEFSYPRLKIRSAKLREMVVTKKKKKNKKRGLFVFPLHSRISGARYPYLWMSIAKENRWHVLIDACASGPKDMDSFGLSLFQPDFLFSSFYKVFGENPSGFGCLFVKKSTISILEPSSSVGMINLVPEVKLFRNIEPEKEKPSVLQLQEYQLATSSSFSGPISYQAIIRLGTLDQAQPSQHKDKIPTSKRDESGTSQIGGQGEVDNLSQNRNIAIECKSLDQVDSMGLILISKRARCLIDWLVSSLTKLKHPNTDGISLVKIFGPKIKFDRGPALAFNIFDWKGEKVEPVLVQKLADRSNISLSYGFLHHIWFSEKYAEEKRRVLMRRGNGGDKKKVKNELGITVVTAALGFLTNFEDMYKLWAFVARFLDADFLEKERWRYTALNQKIIEV